MAGWGLSPSGGCPLRPELPGPGGAAGGAAGQLHLRLLGMTVALGAGTEAEHGQRVLRGSGGQGWDQGPEPGPRAPSLLWRQQQQAPLRTNTHFPLFMLLQDSHSFQLSKLGTFTDSVSTRASSVACLAGSHVFQVPYPWVAPSIFKSSPQRVPPGPGLQLVGEGLVQATSRGAPVPVGL